MISQHWFRWWLGAGRQQAITWANVDRLNWQYDITRPQCVNHEIIISWSLIAWEIVIDNCSPLAPEMYLKMLSANWWPSIIAALINGFFYEYRFQLPMLDKKCPEITQSYFYVSSKLSPIYVVNSYWPCDAISLQNGSHLVSSLNVLTHWHWVMHICITKLGHH